MQTAAHIQKNEKESNTSSKIIIDRLTDTLRIQMLSVNTEQHVGNTYNIFFANISSHNNDSHCCVLIHKRVCLRSETLVVVGVCQLIR